MINENGVVPIDQKEVLDFRGKVIEFENKRKAIKDGDESAHEKLANEMQAFLEQNPLPGNGTPNPQIPNPN